MCTHAVMSVRYPLGRLLSILPSALPTLGFLVSACQGRACQEYAVPGIFVTAVDARTGASLAEVAVVVVRDGTYVDSSHVDDGAVAWERPGVYEVRVRAPGYRDWIRPRVRVASDGCHVRTAQVDAQLKPIR